MRSLPLFSCLTVLSGMAFALATPARADTWTITPSVTVRGTYTDNATLAPRGQEKSDFVTEVAPGIRIDGTGGRVKLRFNYQADEVLYTGGTAGNRLQNNLNAFGSVEAIDKFFFIESSAAIFQQNLSAFGPQVFSSASATSNRVESRNFSLSPYIRGNLAGTASYLVRYNYVKSSSGGTGVSSSDSSDWIAQVNSLSSMSVFGWGLDYSRRTTHYTAANNLDTEAGRASLVFQADPQLRANVYVGREKNNYNLTDQTATTHGFGIDWAPSERTKLNAHRDHRFFGTGYGYSFSHRTPLTAVNLSFDRDVTSTTDQFLARMPTQDYLVFSNIFSGIADPVERDRFVRVLLALLGRPADAFGLVFTNRPFLDRRLQGSFAINGANNTLLLSAYRSKRQPIGANTIVGDFSIASELTQSSLSANLSHKLSPVSSLNFIATATHTTGSSVSAAKSTERYLNLLYSTQLSPKTTGSLGLRNSRTTTELSGANTTTVENAVTGTLSVLF